MVLGDQFIFVILDTETLIAITGRKRPSAQLAWLVRQGWKHNINGLGQPVVAIAEFNRHLVGGRIATSHVPNYEGIHG